MIIDGHAHFINKEIAKDITEDAKRLDMFKEISVTEGKKEWLEVMDKYEIEKTVFMGLSPGNKDFTEFINSSDRFIGMSNVDPTKEDAVELLDKDIKDGYKGLKLYPTARAFDVADEKAKKVYDYCEKKKLPIVIHFGVSIGPSTDLRFGNPISLAPILRDYPGINFVIAHFGAGYFKEALMLMYKKDNLLFDTSGTNNWLCFSPYDWDLRYVFKKALQIVGSEKIIFGTDTLKIWEGYREEILKQQVMLVEELSGKNGKDNIFYNNAKRIFNI